MSPYISWLLRVNGLALPLVILIFAYMIATESGGGFIAAILVLITIPFWLSAANMIAAGMVWL